MIQSAFEGVPTRGTRTKAFWLTPPELYKELDEEFHFDHDPCPFPRQGFDGLTSDWGQSNFVNPPYAAGDGSPYSKWVYKCIEEHKKGKTVVLLHPTTTCEFKMFQRKPDLRPIGRIKWVATDGSGDRMAFRNFIAVILRGDGQ